MSGERLTRLDASFLQGENESAPMNVGGVDVFAGPAPSTEQFTEHLERRLHLLPRFRQRIASVPLGLGRPRWTDDTKFRLSYHLRHTALPAPGGADQLSTLFARILEQPLDRGRPLWEMWLVEGLEGGRFAVLHKFHHTLVDGIASVSVIQTIFDSQREPQATPAPRAWEPRRGPSRVRLLAGAAAERAVPPELVSSLGTLVRHPMEAAGRTAGALAGLGPVVGRGALRFAPRGPYNRKVGPTGALPGRARPSMTSRRSRTPSTARSTTSCSPRWRECSPRTCARAGRRARASSSRSSCRWRYGA